jgi:integrase/recombinase XerC/integrase/recombinase XerD
MEEDMTEIIPAITGEVVSTDSPEDKIQAFLDSLDVAEKSRATYTRSLKQFISWMRDTGRQSLQLQREDILAYKEYLAGSKSPYTITLYLTSVRKLYQWLESQRMYPDITRGIKGAKKPKGFRKDTLSQNQLREVLDSMELKSLEELRDYAIFNLMARTGLRDIEVSRALTGDIRMETGQPVLWIQGKGRDSKDDFVILTPEALNPIKAYLKARGRVNKAQALFCSHSDRNRGEALSTRSISRIIKNSMRAVGLDDSRLTAHSLRHTAITLSIKGGASLQQAQAMARHTDPKTTLVYFHNLDRIQAGAEKFIDF